MKEKTSSNSEGQRKLDRKKQALRDNLRRRKTQIKDLSNQDTGELKPRKKGFKPDDSV